MGGGTSRFAPSATGRAHPGTLLAGLLAGNLARLAIQAPAAWSRMRGLMPGGAECRTLLRHELRFAGPAVLAAVFRVVALNLPALLMTRLHGAEAGGHFLIATKLAFLGDVVIGSAVATVYHNRIGQATVTAPGEVMTIVGRFLRPLLLLAVVIGVAMVLFGPQAVRLLFGGHWEQAAGWCRLLAPITAANLLVLPLSTTLLVLRRPAMQAVADALLLCGIAAPFLVAPVLDLGPDGTVQTLAWSWSAGNLLGLVLIGAGLHHHQRKVRA